MHLSDTVGAARLRPVRSWYSCRSFNTQYDKGIDDGIAKQFASNVRIPMATRGTLVTYIKRIENYKVLPFAQLKILPLLPFQELLQCFSYSSTHLLYLQQDWKSSYHGYILSSNVPSMLLARVPMGRTTCRKRIDFGHEQSLHYGIESRCSNNGHS